MSSKFLARHAFSLFKRSIPVRSISLSSVIKQRDDKLTSHEPDTSAIFTEEHYQLRKSLRKLIDKDINPYVDEWEAAGEFPAHKLFKKLGDAGIFGVNKPQEFGGLGLDWSYSLAVAEELGYIDCGSIPMAIGVQADMATPALAKYGSDGLKKQFLAPAVAGDVVVSIAVSEPSAGSDVAAIKTKAVKKGDDYIINGSKMWITNGMQADWICLLANTGAGPAHKNKSLIIVPMDTSGIQRVKINKLGMHSSDTAQIFFEDVHVPISYRIGEENLGFIYQMQQFQLERLFASASGFLTAIIDRSDRVRELPTMYGLLASSQTRGLDVDDGLGALRKESAVSYFRSMPEPFDDVEDTLPDFRLVSRRLDSLRSHESGDVSFENGASPVLSSMHYDDLSTDSGVSGLSQDISLDTPDFSRIPDVFVYADEAALTPKATPPRSFSRRLFKNFPASPRDDPESLSGYRPLKRSIAVEQSRPVKRPNLSGDPFCQPASLEEFSTETMTGDYKGSCCLPVLLRGSPADLNCISSRTLGSLLNGVYADIVRSYRIIDCRYPYEFDAGHILNAVNIWQQDAVIRELINSDEHRPTEPDSGRHVVIFHCEFSSERGPKMSRFLRNADRKENMDRYPMLYHPEMYLLQGGYKDFFHHLPELCRPQIYKPMMHPNHVTEVRHFRVKSKSWAGSKCKVRQ